MLKTVHALIGVLALGAAASASATPVTFDLGSDSSAKITSFEGSGFLCAITDCGVSVSLNPALGSLSRTLNAGESWTFDFLKLSFYGLGGGSGTLAATLAFDAPTSAPDASNVGYGSFFTFILTGGYLNWATPEKGFTLADGTSYSISFQNLAGIAWGTDVNVRARLTLNNGPVASVPEPGTLGLFGLGLLGAGFAGRRRARKNAS